MPEQNRVYKWYLVIAIVYSSISVLGSIAIAFLGVSTSAQILTGVILAPLLLGMLLFNIVMFIVFVINNIEKAAWVLSGLSVFDFVFSATVGVILFVVLGESAGESMIGHVAGMIFPVITLILAIKLLNRS